MKLFESTADTFGIGAWLVGTTTMREFAGRNAKLKPARERIERTDFIADRRARRFAIGADAKGVLRFQRGDLDGDHVVLLVSERVSDDYLAHLREAGASYLFCGPDQVDLRVALDKLRRTLGTARHSASRNWISGCVTDASFSDFLSPWTRSSSTSRDPG